MTIITNLIKSEQNGIEFYTVAATGESGISQSGLAKLCGIADSTVANFVKTLSSFEKSNSSESPSSLNYEDFTLSSFGKKAVANGKEVGNLKLYNARFCIALIKHYAEKGKKEALFSLMKFAELGFETWVQQITGWKPPIDQPLLEPEQSIAEPEPPLLESLAIEVKAESIEIPHELALTTSEESTLHPALKFIKDAIAIGEQLGGFSQTEQEIVRQQLAKAIQLVRLSEMVDFKDPTHGAEPQSYTISERAAVLGHRLNAAQSSTAGKMAAAIYRQKHDKNPPQRSVPYNGGIAYVNIFSGRDLAIADVAIQTVIDRGY